jgi:hypothetical protein
VGVPRNFRSKNGISRILKKNGISEAKTEIQEFRYKKMEFQEFRYKKRNFDIKKGISGISRNLKNF